MKNYFLNMIALLSSLQLISGCFGDKVAGTTTTGNSDNAKVSGYIYTLAGEPSASTRVDFIPIGYNPHIGVLVKQATADTLSATTNERGYYGTNDLEPGTYNVYGVAPDGNLSLIDSVVITEDTLVIVPDTVKAPGSIEGFIKLQPGDEPDKIIAIVMGSNDFFIVNVDASFRLTNLAEGEYSLKFFSTLDKYSNLDTNIFITAGETLVGTDSIAIPLKIPIPTNFSLEYDTLKQIVRISWDKMDEKKVVGYNVYRKLEGGADSLLTAVAITDTFFVDSTVVQDETYEYSVASVGEGEEVGVKGIEIGIEVLAAFELIDSMFIPVSNLSSIDISTNSILYCLNVDAKVIIAIDTDIKNILNTIEIHDSLGVPKDIKVLNDSTLILATGTSIVQVSINGIIEKIWHFSSPEIQEISITGSTVYFIQGDNPSQKNYSVQKVDLETGETTLLLNLATNFQSMDSDLIEGIGSSNSVVAVNVRHFTNGTDWFSTFKYFESVDSLVQINTMDWANNQNPFFKIYNENILLSTSNQLNLFQNESQILMDIPSFTTSIATLNFTNVFIAGYYNQIYFYKIRL